MRPILHDSGLEDELLDTGYVRVPMLDGPELAEAVAAFEQLRPDDRFEPDGTGLNRSSYHCTFLDTNLEYKRTTQELITRIFQPKIDAVAVDYRILTGNFYVKMPGKGRFQIHQNWPTTEDLSVTTLTLWCPLHDTNEANGTLRVVPGSHKIVPDVATPQRPPFFAAFEDELIADHLVPICLKAGEGLLFDDSLVHWSSENRSDRPRRAVQIEAVPAEVQPVLYHLDETASPPRWELFDVDGRFFIDHSIDQVIGPPSGLRLRGMAPYVNRELTLAEFTDLLRRGPEIRRGVYTGQGWPERAGEA